MIGASKAHWRSNSWASIQAKRKETCRPFSGELDQWKHELKKYNDDKQAYCNGKEQSLEHYRENIQRQIASGAILLAGKSNDPELAHMQAMVDKMAKANHLQAPVVLLHTAASKSIGHTSFDIGVMVPEFIDVNEEALRYFKENPQYIRLALAHEMAHIANGDREVDNIVEWFITPVNQKREILADRRAAIIYGRPYEYAELRSQYFFDNQKEIEPHIHELNYLSANSLARMLYKWADLLAEQGAVDDRGVVVYDKAMKLFESSRDFTEGLFKFSLALDITHPIKSHAAVEVENGKAR